MFLRREEIEKELETASGDTYNNLMMELNHINSTVEEKEKVRAVSDPLIDKWEEQFMSGETPDLEEGLPSA